MFLTVEIFFFFFFFLLFACTVLQVWITSASSVSFQIQTGGRVLLSLLFGHSVMSNSLWPHELQQIRLPCPSPSPRACPMSQWCHPTVSASVVPFSSCFQSFPGSESFLIVIIISMAFNSSHHVSNCFA